MGDQLSGVGEGADRQSWCGRAGLTRGGTPATPTPKMSPRNTRLEWGHRNSWAFRES